MHFNIKKLFSFALLFILSLFLFSCNGDLAGDMRDVSAGKYVIGGMGPGGGIVFYTTDNGVHGLEVCQNDLGSGVWNDAVVTPPSSTSPYIGTGMMNTLTMIAQGTVTGSARLCRNYNGGGFTDWFLPSKDELNLIYVNLTLNGIGGMGTLMPYWSSTQDVVSYSWCQNFSSGVASTQSFALSNNITRAVRAF